VISREEAVAKLSAYMRGHQTLEGLEAWAHHAWTDGDYEPGYAEEIGQIVTMVGEISTGARRVPESEFYLALARLGACYCPRCGRIRWQPKDREGGSCGACHA
jgi:putative hemolysin